MDQANRSFPDPLVEIMSYQTRPIFFALLSLSALLACTSVSDADSTPLEQIVACNDRAVGGDALRSIESLEIELDIVEPQFAVRGTYVASRSGSMRIDIFSDDTRVFSEGISDGSAWKMGQNDQEPLPVGDEPAAALRHGLEKPGRFWTFADMERRGHDLVLEGQETRDGRDYWVLKLTLDDGHTVWYLVDQQTCLVGRSRDFRAFHPDIDPKKTWIETLYEDFRVIDGVTHALLTRNIDMKTGETIGTTTALSIRSHTKSRD